MTKIAAALCWFDEPVERLEEMVRSLPDVVDELVALDGPWMHFRYGDLSSPREQYEAIVETAADVGLGTLMLDRRELWESQVAKRHYLYRRVAQRADWMLVVDGDEVLERRGDLRALLDAVGEDVGVLPLSWIRQDRRGYQTTARRLFRTCHGLGVMETHNGIVTDDGRWLAGPRRVEREPAFDAGSCLGLTHWHMARGERRNAASQQYYRVRARERIEVH